MNNEKNKNNTVLLTIIGIATLLVAVTGATFAYFTAQLTGNETDTTIVVGAGTMTMAYDGGDPNLLPQTATGIMPQPTSTEFPYGEPVITKSFSITGNNTTAANMPYEIEIAIVNNTFQAGSLVYMLTGSKDVNEPGVIIADTTTAQPIPRNTTGEIEYVSLGTGRFFGPVSGSVHTYTIYIYFPNLNVNQDADKLAAFSGFVNTKVLRAYTTVAP